MMQALFPAGDLDIGMLPVLHALLETRSVTRAAERLGISQPAASRCLARLRESLGDPLMIRSGGGMVLTPRAQAMIEPLGQWLAEGKTLIAAPTFDPSTLTRVFRLASTDFGVLSVLTPVLGSITRAAPNIQLVVEPLVVESNRQLAAGHLDIVITGLDPDPSTAHLRFLFRERNACIARSGHPGLVNGTMSVEAFLEAPHVEVSVAGVKAAMFKAGQEAGERRTILRTDNFMLAPYMVAESDAIMTLPSRAARRFVRKHDLVLFDPPIAVPDFDYWLAWHERSRRDPATLWLIDQLAAPFGRAAQAA